MTSRERIIAALSHREADRVPVLEEIWSTTATRWVREGMPKGGRFDRYLLSSHARFSAYGFMPAAPG